MSAVSPAPELLELGVDDLLDALATPEEPAAGGSAAALAVAMAAAVVEKAARRSRGRWDDAGGASAQARALRLRAAPLASADARALAEAAELLGGRGEGAAAPELRDYELGRALGRAAEVPLLIAQVGADVAALAREIAEHGDRDARADSVAAAALAQAGTRAAAHLVEVNLGTTTDDLRVQSARSLAAAAEAWAAAALALDR